MLTTEYLSRAHLIELGLAIGEESLEYCTTRGGTKIKA